MENRKGPVDFIMELHRLTGLPVLDCLSALHAIQPNKWERFVERVKENPELLKAPTRPAS